MVDRQLASRFAPFVEAVPKMLAQIFGVGALELVFRSSNEVRLAVCYGLP